jgi:hypothetical protein
LGILRSDRSRFETFGLDLGFGLRLGLGLGLGVGLGSLGF